MEDARLTDVRKMLRVLLTEEELMEALIELGLAQQHALMISDFYQLELVSEQLLAVASGMGPLGDEREAALESLGVARLHEAVALADDLGEGELGTVRDRLLERALRFRGIQERNAELILAASRLRQRWVNLLAGMSGDGTYGSGGKGERQQSRRLVSKSA
jgi:flagellar biosynthesis/type III secretory pathway chaperone